MKHALTIAAREVAAMFATPLGWILLGLHMVFTGYLFFGTLREFVRRIEEIQAAQALQYLEQFNLNDGVINASFGAYELVFIFLIPILTMRLFAEERANGTIELLLTSPLTSTELVIGKYLGVLSVVGIMVGLSALYPALLFFYGNPEFWQTVSTLLVLFMLGSALAALGCFTSSLTRSPAAAAVIAMVVGLMLLVATFIADQVSSTSSLGSGFASFLRYAGIAEHFEQGLRGLIRTQDLVYFGTFIVFFLALARTGVESMRVR